MWIDQDLCTGDGLCVDHCPEAFLILEDGISYVHDGQWIGNDPGQWESTITVPGGAARHPGQRGGGGRRLPG